MSISLLTNVAALDAQENLTLNNNFQSQTIQRLSSGYRINSAEDNPSGLAIANEYRRDTAEVTQGVQNANNGISALQIMDGGISNISQILDRLKTLATQSASQSFTGDRNTLNSEFQTLIAEVSRQAQSIGLNEGGQYAKALSFYVGGATGNNTVSVDLSKSALDSRSLGLGIANSTGLQVVAGSTDIGTTSSQHSVAKILADSGNTTSTSGYTDFYITGPGFSDGNKLQIAVNLQGVTDINSLVAAVNSAITTASMGTSAPAQAFKAAELTASVYTDASGGQELSFGSQDTAFQVEAGDVMANALMGNLSGSTGDPLNSTVSGSSTTAGSFDPTGITLQVSGAGLSAPVDLTFTPPSPPNLTVTDVVNQINSNTQLQAAGISVSGTPGSALTFTDSHGETFSLQATGDLNNNLGLGTFLNGAGGGVDYTTVQGAPYSSPAGPGTEHLEFSFDGAASVAVDLNLSGGESGATVEQMLNDAFATTPALETAGLTASFSGGALSITSSNNTFFRLNAATSTADLGFGTSGSTFSANLTAPKAFSLPVDSAGASGIAPLTFTPMAYGSDDQNLTISATDANGNVQSQIISLSNDGQSRVGQDIDSTVASINAQLQANSAFAGTVAVKEDIGGVEQINLLSNLPSFNVIVGNSPNGNGLNGGASVSVDSSLVGGSRNLSIDTQQGAEQAITAITNAVSVLGAAQAVVGKGENQLTYAMNLSQSEITSFSAADSSIRDADVAAEAANLSKSQVMQQATVAAMAQANTSAQAILSLLKG